MTKVKKYQLEFEQEFDFDMVGISTHHSDYRLAWCLNAELGMHFTRSEEPYILVPKKKSAGRSSHIMYEYCDEENHTDYYLIKNKAEGKFLVPEKPSIDFFVFICDAGIIDIDAFTENLRKVSSVMATFTFYPEEIESCANLVFK